jgi:hypothetical protein
MQGREQEPILLNNDVGEGGKNHHGQRGTNAKENDRTAAFLDSVAIMEWPLY